ncbi:hypothetical protein [Mucilaginibacter myungsuensis]|uniref:Uncharacterized protein n=1 Tax=Mucilaginibacter myungsuensis TaxID=649104 RepID=A0A929PWD8_9SPHI|nr:hypothetical protein [Mucilaginibacter myungsuensis]MBE9662029.1 hypothetical protein [Mucilaginibacter myungsuensis]MDN3599538.1 hypothetical protein [Mucilaginibacter myungsuensis]
MTPIEQQQLKGFTIKTLVMLTISTASIVASVMATYFELKTSINAVQTNQEAQTRVNEIRLNVLEGQIAVLQTEVAELKERR